MESKNVMLAVLIISMMLLSGCTSSIEDVKSEEKVGETVRVSGQVEESIKLGELSGYIITGETGSIAISSNELPAKGDNVTVKGTLEKAPLMGWYIDAK